MASRSHVRKARCIFHLERGNLKEAEYNWSLLGFVQRAELEEFLKTHEKVEALDNLLRMKNFRLCYFLG
jgi:hypothetical protein